MSRFLPIMLTLMAVATFGVAYDYIYKLDPADPIVPLLCTFLGGIAFRQSFDHLAERN